MDFIWKTKKGVQSNTAKIFLSALVEMNLFYFQNIKYKIPSKVYAHAKFSSFFVVYGMTFMNGLQHYCQELNEI